MEIPIKHCRLCYSSDQCENIFDNYIKHEKKLLNLAEVVGALLGIEVKINLFTLNSNKISRKLMKFQIQRCSINPTKICRNCKDRIVTFFFFKEKCLKVNRNFSEENSHKKETTEIFDEDVYEEVAMVVKAYMARFCVASVEVEEDSERLIISSTATLTTEELPTDEIFESEEQEQETDLLIEPAHMAEVEEDYEILIENQMVEQKEVQQFEITIVKDEQDSQGEVRKLNNCVHCKGHFENLKTHLFRCKVKEEKVKQISQIDKNKKTIVCEFCHRVFPKSSELK